MSIIESERLDNIALVTLNDPERRNALSLDMCRALAETIHDLDSSPDINAIIITGRGRAFCAGADLSHLESSARDGLLAIYEGFLAVARTSVLTIAAVNGPAVGAGLNLALACDIRVVNSGATFDPRFMKLGLHPGGGHTWLLQRLAGPEVAAAMVLCGDAVRGPQLVERGLATRCVPDDELLSTARQMANDASQAPKELVVRIKASMAETATAMSHADALELELDAQIWSIAQPAFSDRIARATSKQSP